MVRRLGPHCGRIELSQFPQHRDEKAILKAMEPGDRQPASGHLGSVRQGAARSRQAEARLAASSSAGHGRSDRAGLEEFPVGRRRGLAPGAAKLAKHAVEAHRHRSSPCSGRGSHLHRIDCGWRDGSRLLASSRAIAPGTSWFDPRFAYRSFEAATRGNHNEDQSDHFACAVATANGFAMPYRRSRAAGSSGEGTLSP